MAELLQSDYVMMETVSNHDKTCSKCRTNIPAKETHYWDGRCFTLCYRCKSETDISTVDDDFMRSYRDAFKERGGPKPLEQFTSEDYRRMGDIMNMDAQMLVGLDMEASKLQRALYAAITYRAREVEEENRYLRCPADGDVGDVSSRLMFHSVAGGDKRRAKEVFPGVLW